MKFANWVAGFFHFDNNQSSKRLVGIVGSFCVFITMLVHHTDISIQCSTAIVIGALGITATEKIFGKKE